MIGVVSTQEAAPPPPPAAAVTIRLDRHVLPWVLALAAMALFIYLFSSVLMPFAAGLALGYLLDPVANRMERLGVGRLGAALIILGAFLILLIGVLVIALPILGHQLAAFVESLPQIVVKLQTLASSESGRIANSWGGDLLQKLGLNTAGSPADLQKSIGDLVGEGAKWLITFARSLLLGGAALVGVFSLLIITPVVAFYILLDWRPMMTTLDGLVPPRYRADVRSIAHDIDLALAGFLRGQSLVCLFLGAWYGIGLTLVGLNFGFLIGITAGFLSFIPYVGSLTALVLAAIVAIVQGWPDWQLLALSIGVVASGQFLEGNLLSPKLVGASVGLHPVWLMFALLAFGSLFGFTGLLIAVPVAAAIGVLLRFALRRYRTSALYLEPSQSGLLIDTSAVQSRLPRKP